MKKHHINRGGAPKGNQNARKHGYYSRVLTPRQQAKLAQANPDPLQELKLMMVKIDSLFDRQPDNYALQLRAIAQYNRVFRNCSLVHKEVFSDLDSNRA